MIEQLTKQLRRLPLWAYSAGALFAAYAVVMWINRDPDFGWHLMSGRYDLRHWIPAHDIFTYTASNFPWINHEWLSDVITAGLMHIGGYGLVVALSAALWAGALMLVGRNIAWPVRALGFAVTVQFATARPDSWSVALFALLLLLLRRKVYWPLVALFTVWANLHGGFVLGLVFVAVASLKDRKYWLVLIGCMLATLVNPYGVRLYIEIWRTLSDSSLHATVIEWQSLQISPINGAYIAAFLVALLASRRRIQFVVAGLMLVIGLHTARQFPFFVLVSLPLVDYGYMRLLAFLNANNCRMRLLFGAFGTALVLIMVVDIVRQLSGGYAPIAAVRDLQLRPCDGRIFNDYDIGGYLEWMLPSEKTYIDGRMPSWRLNGVDYYANWRSDIASPAAADRDFERYNVGCVILKPTQSTLVYHLKQKGWMVTATDPTDLLLRRPK